jgi:hypothetical protein
VPGCATSGRRASAYIFTAIRPSVTRKSRSTPAAVQALVLVGAGSHVCRDLRGPGQHYPRRPAALQPRAQPRGARLVYLRDGSSPSVFSPRPRPSSTPASRPGTAYLTAEPGRPRLTLLCAYPLIEGLLIELGACGLPAHATGVRLGRGSARRVRALATRHRGPACSTKSDQLPRLPQLRSSSTFVLSMR